MRFAIFCAFSINAKGGCAKHEQGKSGLVKRCWPKSAISRKDLLHLNQKLMINTKFTKYHCLDCSNFWPCTLMCTVPTRKIEVRKNHTGHCFAFQPVASSRVKKMPVKAKGVSNWDLPSVYFTTQITEKFSTAMCSEMAGVYTSILLSWLSTRYTQQHKVNCRVHTRVFFLRIRSPPPIFPNHLTSK